MFSLCVFPMSAKINCFIHFTSWAFVLTHFWCFTEKKVFFLSPSLTLCTNVYWQSLSCYGAKQALFLGRRDTDSTHIIMTLRYKRSSKKATKRHRRPYFSQAGNELGMSSFLTKNEFLNDCSFHLVPSWEWARSSLLTS